MAEAEKKDEAKTAESPKQVDSLEQATLNEIHAFLQEQVATPVPGYPRDQLDGRYSIHTSRLLPEFSTPHAKAYEATDEQQKGREIYAVVCPNTLPYRKHAIEALKEFTHPNLVSLLAAGVIELTGITEARQVLIFERPQGKSLAALIAEQKAPLPERFIMQEIMGPLADLLQQFERLGISHGRINLGTVYLGEKVMLGECLSEPCGMSQPFLYEPIDRAMTMPCARGEDSVTIDMYALGVVGYFLVRGTLPPESLNADQYIAVALQQGCYVALTRDQEFSEALNDLFRGLLNDLTHERWHPAQLKLWAEGKRYNLIPPPQPREASRAFAFEGEDYFSRKALAGAIQRHWEAAKTLLKDNRVVRWVELSMHRVETAEQLTRIVKNAGGGAREKETAEYLTRMMIALDSSGPIRQGQLSLRVEGMGVALADMFREKRNKDMQTLFEMIDAELPGYWGDLHKAPHSAELSNYLFRIQKTRLLLRATSLGFGLERCLYDLNPTLPCQSPLLLKEHVTTLEEALTRLDRMAASKAREFSPLDRHIAAFIASRIDIPRDVRIAELEAFPALQKNPSVIALKILCSAQEKIGNKKLHGLTGWMGMNLVPVLGYLHNRAMRKRMLGFLKNAALSGNLNALMAVVLRTDISQSDKMGFDRARTQYHGNATQIETLRDARQTEKRAREIGEKLAISLAYFLCGGVLIFVLNLYMG